MDEFIPFYSLFTAEFAKFISHKELLIYVRTQPRA
ncbi:MAG: hypothetical protein K0S31_4626 [Sphingobacterium multivorum]|jgi:hypothetical protein|nr:hypothetical protein [Sphingobacterium multivorum]